MKFWIIFALFGIVASLGSALFFMMRNGDKGDDHSRSKNMARALTIRIVLSIMLFLGVLIAWQLGYIQPTGIRIGP
ncbi:twin transmembrane helix small protein [Rhodoferax sp.]|uniref:twin transmembrane helix small protein n=1 Tax=Rhodoferax sp. TaxID=50421 RepID=UPI002844B57B|nr:twin transmembrane helix small protein [Rhodoferax sp.]MDR3371166.1 twin transmembrane helix small protein [Rhodoferax sp.]